MNLNASFPGETIRFEGHRTVVLRQLPAGAQIQSARVTVTPKAPPGAPDRLFEEVLVFPAGGPLGDFGMTRVVAPGGGPVLGAVEVDVRIREEALLVSVRNDGVPHSPTGPRPGGSGFGLIGMNERVAALDGTLTAGPTAPGVWTVFALLPLRGAR